MSDKRRNEGRKGPPPLNPVRLEELALAYVARFATTQAKLRLYLQRKARERGWDGDDANGGEVFGALEELVGRYAEKGYVDDAAWAKMKAGSLLRRGYGARRVGEALGQAGVNEDLRAEQRPGLGEQRRAALVLARRRRFGPFAVQRGDSEVDPKLHDKQLAAMLRAGHPLDIARRIVESDDADALEEWGESEFGDD
ncbi:regulatory protein RecX [Novosphingobium barchaimii LL02]|uniref:Regulatory protein RecX n=1 Tax=Novosphingobium barchaimii LL02 TaxID=1114963 RepID=A0A0J7Y8A1_9SPHN|nr:RecX family transcriptional regulator [Novosphingobium barchaimii]KMS60184.1 regulatory protein RecX [Novosphingobium barchaimii LL02]